MIEAIFGQGQFESIVQALLVGCEGACGCVRGCAGVWVCGCMGVWVYGCDAVWVCVCVWCEGVWACGRMGVWTCGRVDALCVREKLEAVKQDSAGR